MQFSCLQVEVNIEKYFKERSSLFFLLTYVSTLPFEPYKNMNSFWPERLL